MPSVSARAAACLRDAAPSLAKISATWRSTVRTESTSCVAISPLVKPRASRRSTSSCRSVRPAGFSRVPATGPRRTFAPRAGAAQPRPVVPEGSLQANPRSGAPRGAWLDLDCRQARRPGGRDNPALPSFWPQLASRHGPARRRDGPQRISCSADGVTLHRTLFEKVGQLWRREAVFMSEGESKVGGGLSVGSGCGSCDALSTPRTLRPFRDLGPAVGPPLGRSPAGR
jgi:hypothetical protein